MLRTPRLLLRELVPSDAAALNQIERNPEVTRYMSFDPQTMEQTRAYIDRAVRERVDAARRTFDLAIVPLFGTDDGADTRELIGRCGLSIRRPEHHEAEVWYVLHPDRRGRGYATEAMSALIGFGFSSLGLHRVYADCDPRNEPSCRLALRLGMTLEGTLRENYWLKGEWCSANIYGVLRSEWERLHGTFKADSP